MTDEREERAVKKERSGNIATTLRRPGRPPAAVRIREGKVPNPLTNFFVTEENSPLPRITHEKRPPVFSLVPRDSRPAPSDSP